MERNFFGYVRVSTPKQGKGVSLTEQREAITRHVQRYGLSITQWFEEQETAAKYGRRVFAQMLRLLQAGKARGVVIHKIDRSARNLKDWADLGDLIDAGVEVHFANESLDLQTRGGRLSADIQAVVAADYIRNLREETKKGFYGRLKQGIYPIFAPIGYKDCGPGRPKERDEERAPLVREAFELYATAHYSLTRLVEEMNSRGLRNRQGGPVTLNGMSTMLNNPFYMGVIRIKKTGELFQGAHQPIIGKSLFDRVQQILDGKTVDRHLRHEFIFRRMVRCRECGYTLIGELQKNYVYYRCHTPTCELKTLREERIERAVEEYLATLRLSDTESAYMRFWFEEARSNKRSHIDQAVTACRLQLEQIRDRLGRLTDAFIDGSIDKQLFEDRKSALVLEEAGLKQRLAALEAGTCEGLIRLEKFLELAKTASNLYKRAIVEEKRDLVKKLTSNLSATPENVVIEPHPGAQILLEREKISSGSQERDVPRTWSHILQKLIGLFDARPDLTPIAN